MNRKLALSDDLLKYADPEKAISISEALIDRPYLTVVTTDYADVHVKRRYQWLYLVEVGSVKEGVEFLEQLGVCLDRKENCAS